jgi:hypothetical protein
MSTRTPRPFKLDFVRGKGREGIQRGRKAIVTDREDTKAFADEIRASEAATDAVITALLRSHREDAQR